MKRAGVSSGMVVDVEMLEIDEKERTDFLG